MIIPFSLICLKNKYLAELLPTTIESSEFKIRDFYLVMFFTAKKSGKTVNINMELFFTGEDSGYLENNLYSLNTASSSDPLPSWLCPAKSSSLNIVTTDGSYVHAVPGVCIIDEDGRIRYSCPEKPQRYIFINGSYETAG